MHRSEHDDPTNGPPMTVIIYDGECNFCRRQVGRVRRRAREGQFEYLPRQTPGLEQRFPAIADADFDSGMRLVEPDGRIRVGADAIHAISRRLPVYRRLAWIYRIPGLNALFRAAYAWIAANRHRLAGKCEDGVCELPDRSSRQTGVGRNPQG